MCESSYRRATRRTHMRAQALSPDFGSSSFTHDPPGFFPLFRDEVAFGSRRLFCEWSYLAKAGKRLGQRTPRADAGCRTCPRCDPGRRGSVHPHWKHPGRGVHAWHPDGWRVTGGPVGRTQSPSARPAITSSANVAPTCAADASLFFGSNQRLVQPSMPRSANATTHAGPTCRSDPSS